METTTTAPAVRYCRHPRSCQLCQIDFLPCGRHIVGTQGHERCKGTDNQPVTTTEESAMTSTETIATLATKAEGIARATGSRSASYTDTIDGVEVTVTWHRARCYQEFCCNQATTNVTDYGQSQASGYVGRWGFCQQHAR